MVVSIFSFRHAVHVRLNFLTGDVLDEHVVSLDSLTLSLVEDSSLDIVEAEHSKRGEIVSDTVLDVSAPSEHGNTQIGKVLPETNLVDAS
jgi:hypothetical protein